MADGSKQDRMDTTQLLALFRAMLTARRVDKVELELTNRGDAFFHVSGAGHEASAALAPHLTDDDWLHPHYRDKALLLARGTPARSFFDALYCSDASHSRGRQMCAHLSDPEHNVVSIPGPVGNAPLHAVGVAAAVKRRPSRPIVVCGLGDGTTQEGEFLEACGEAVRRHLPVLFVVQDNRWAISTRTSGQTFYSLPDGDAHELFGMPIHRVDGRDVATAYDSFGRVIAQMRADRRPALIVFEVERLTNHTNADDQTCYRDASDIERARASGDPLRIAEDRLLAAGCTEARLAEIRAEVESAVAAAEAEAATAGDPLPSLTAKRPLSVELTHPSWERRGEADDRSLTMREAMHDVLRNHLRDDPRVFLYGEDIADPKGDVFGLTRGLSTEFPGRVQNSPLSESTIIGTSIGRALAGERPVAFLQFADFLPLAYNQIASDLGSMHWRSDGAWQAPVIVMIPCGGYRPGLGPFHAHSLESIATHVPGLDVFMPSTATDCAGMLNAAFRSGRPTLFFYPKSLLNDPERATSDDVQRQFVPIGSARKARVGRDITFVGWGNTVKLCEAAAVALERVGVEAEVLDLRSLSPWDERTVLASAEKTARLVVVHEDNHTCGFGAEVLATVAEKTRVPVAMRRVTRPDTYVPCNFANQLEVLPSFKRVLTTAAGLLDIDISWLAPPTSDDGLTAVEAIGSGPADETVEVVELFVRVGDLVERGAPLAALEATKSVFELTAPLAGVVEEIVVRESETVAVGATMFKLRAASDARRRKSVTQERSGTPVLVRRPQSGRLIVPQRASEHRAFDVGISSVATITGRRVVSNAELLGSRREMSSDDIIRRTGIEHRHWADQDENAVEMAVRACWKLLDREGLILDDLDALICSTTSPTSVTPSMACRVLNGLSGGKTDAMIQAYDINAACSGYLYALQAGYDYLQSMPAGRVLIVTAEVLSPLLDPEDFDTAILFGDAASASILYGENHFEHARARLFRPDLSAKGEDGSTLSVPLLHDGFIQMKGRRVFSEAVRSMVASLNRVCVHAGINVNDLDLVIPHQANQRIIDAVQHRVGVSVFSNIRNYGNTSSSSIPLCLDEVLPTIHGRERIGLCAFGGGFTFGAGIVELR